MPAKEHGTEQIKYLTDLLRLFWLSLLGIGGGTVTLLLGELGAIKAVFAAVGIAILTALVAVLIALDQRIRQLIGQLKEI